MCSSARSLSFACLRVETLFFLRGGSYHYISDGPSSPEAYGGAKMVHSAVTETLANVRT